MLMKGFFEKFLLLILCSFFLTASSCAAQVKEYKIKVVNTYPHSTDAYTQGLFFHDGSLYESTGQFGSSSFRMVEMKTGKAQRKLDFGKKYFVEGSVMLDGSLYILTWTNKVAFVYDAKTLKYEKTYSYPREGWGLTTDGSSLIASDGSSKIYFMDKDFKQQRSISVTLNGRPVRYLNELEWIDGKIWANVYLTDMIVIINPKSGKVEATIDCTNLLSKQLKKPDTDVLNGIAYNPETKKIYLTGKNWPRLFEIELQ